MNNKEDEEDNDEFEVVFEPDEVLIMALNEIDSLKHLIEDQNASVEIAALKVVQILFPCRSMRL